MSAGIYAARRTAPVSAAEPLASSSVPTTVIDLIADPARLRQLDVVIARSASA